MRQNLPRKPGGVSRAATACYILFAALLLYAAARFSGTNTTCSSPCAASASNNCGKTVEPARLQQICSTVTARHPPFSFPSPP